MITKQELVKRIEGLLDELKDSYSLISKSEELNELEYELFEVNAIYFTEHVKILRKFELDKKAKLSKKEENETSLKEVSERVISDELKGGREKENSKKDQRGNLGSTEKTDFDVAPISSEHVKPTSFTPESEGYESENKQKEKTDSHREEKQQPEYGHSAKTVEVEPLKNEI